MSPTEMFQNRNFAHYKDGYPCHNPYKYPYYRQDNRIYSKYRHVIFTDIH